MEGKAAGSRYATSHILPTTSALVHWWLPSTLTVRYHTAPSAERYYPAISAVRYLSPHSAKRYHPSFSAERSDPPHSAER